MRMPGFTAEASLYKTSEFYRLAADRGFPIEERAAVFPQQACNWFQCGSAIFQCINNPNPVACITAIAPACLPCIVGLL